MNAFNSCVLKLTAVCNLDCTYCYMFNLNDRVYTRLPPFLSIEAARCTLDRIFEHLEATGQPDRLRLDAARRRAHNVAAEKLRGVA